MKYKNICGTVLVTETFGNNAKGTNLAQKIIQRHVCKKMDIIRESPLAKNIDICNAIKIILEADSQWEQFIAENPTAVLTISESSKENSDNKPDPNHEKQKLDTLKTYFKKMRRQEAIGISDIATSCGVTISQAYRIINQDVEVLPEHRVSICNLYRIGLVKMSKLLGEDVPAADGNIK